MTSLLPHGLRSKSATVDEQQQPDQASKIIETTTTTFHDAQPTLETSPLSSSRLITEEFVDAQEPSTEAVTENKESSSLLDKAQSIVDRIMSSVATTLPLARRDEKDTETHENLVEATTPVVQSTTSEETVSSSTVTLPQTIDSEPLDRVETHDTVKSYELPTLRTRQAEVTEFDDQSIDTSESKSETSLSATAPTEETTNISESSVQLQQQDADVPNVGSDYFLSRDVYHGYKQPLEPRVDREESPSLTDRASSFVTGLISSVTSHLPSSVRRASSSGESPVSSTVDDEPNLPHPSAEVKSEQEAEHPSTSGLLGIMKSFLPLGHRSDSATVEEEQRSDESSKIITTTSHEINDDSQAVLKTSPVSASQLTSEEYLDAQDFPTEPANENNDSSSLQEKATSIVERIMSSVAATLPGSKLNEKDTEPQEPGIVEDTIPALQSTTSEATVSSSAVTLPQTIDLEPLDRVETHDTVKSYELPTLRTRQAEVNEFDDQTIDTSESKSETSLSATAPIGETTNILESSDQLQQQDADVPT